jgi:YD repeat-containing protein
LVAAGPVTKWATTVGYDGLATTTTPPDNTGASEPGIAATTVTADPYGRTVSRVQNQVATGYAYDTSGDLIKITSPLGKVTGYGYDWLGRRTSTSDPDAGTSTSDYYPSGILKHSRDAKGQDLFTAIDVLGRATGTYAGVDATATRLTQTVYDGVPLGGAAALRGMVTSRTAFEGGDAYDEAFGYDGRYRIWMFFRPEGDPVAYFWVSEVNSVTGFADEFARLMASGGRRRPSSPNEIVEAWEAFVVECEDGYGWGTYEYKNELDVRDAIESALRAPMLGEYPELDVFQARVAEIDTRFMALLAAGPEVSGPDHPWWSRRLPCTGGQEFASDVRRLFGMELTVV